MRELTVVLVLIASWAAPRLEATVVVQAELPELVAEARTIVHGRVISTEPRAVNGGRSIETLVVIEADDYLKGNLGSRLAIRVPGGQIGVRRAVVIGAPVFRSGDHVVLFLAGAGPALPWIVGLNQGVFRVRQDEVRRLGKAGIDELQVFQEQVPHVRSGNAAQALPLTIFKARVRSLVNEGGAR
jgi:hypothetical protein